MVEVAVGSVGGFPLYQRGHPVLTATVDAHASQDLTITVITIEEELAGWYSLLRQALRVRCLHQPANSVPP